jgi:hypothetical protein
VIARDQNKVNKEIKEQLPKEVSNTTCFKKSPKDTVSIHRNGFTNFGF